MALKIKCACGKKLAIDAKHLGKKIVCPACSKAFRIPEEKVRTLVAQARQRAAIDDPVAVGADDTNSACAPSSLDDEVFGGLSGGDDSSGAGDLLGLMADDAASAPGTRMAQPVADSGGDSYRPATAQEASLAGGRYAAMRLPKTAPLAHTGIGPTCPSCGQVLPDTAKLCVKCGINALTGRSVIMSDDGAVDAAYEFAEKTLGVLSYVLRFGFSPIASEAYGKHKPYAIRSIAVLTVLISAWFWAYEWTDSPKMESMKQLMLWTGRHPGDVDFDEVRAQLKKEHPRLPDEAFDQAVGHLQHQIANMGSYQPYQLFTNIFLHGGLLHLAGNLVFLLIFGSRVNALIGNLMTAALYPILGVIASWAYYISARNEMMHPALGASGAIMGLAGMYLILFPLHKVHMAIWFRWRWLTPLWLKLFAVRGFWVVLFYIAFDVLFTVFGIKDHTAHWAHLGGFIAGVVVALALVMSRLINARGGDMISAILGRRAWAIVGKPRA